MRGGNCPGRRSRTRSSAGRMNEAWAVEQSLGQGGLPTQPLDDGVLDGAAVAALVVARPYVPLGAPHSYRRAGRSEPSATLRRSVQFESPEPRGAFMPTYLSPGIYMEEVSSGSKPIQGVGTAVAAFVGFAASG